MRLLTIFFVCVILFQINVFAELSSSSCALLRTASSFTAIIPELTQLAMRYYRASLSFSTEHSRQKRFLFNENTAKDSSSGNIKGSVVEQMIANAVRDVNFTNVAILILSNNETMNKIRKHVDSDAIIRLIMREINYEKLANGFWSVAGTEFDLEHFTASIINKTNIDIIHNELLTNGTLPEWLLKSIHPELNIIAVQRVFSTLKNVTEKFVEILSKSERFDNYLFNMITQQTLTPLNNILEGIKEKKPKNFTQLVGIIVDNLNRVATVDQIEFFERILLLFSVTLGTIFNKYKRSNNEKTWKEFSNNNCSNSRS